MLNRLRRYSLYINLKKYEFFVIEVEFLDFIISIINIIINKRRVIII